MRYGDIKLVEYQDLRKAKDQIIRTISGLDASNQQQAEILDRVWKVLNRDDVKEKVRKIRY
jgi:mannitol/fructose-specific phosphotransferase system IIA component